MPVGSKLPAGATVHHVPNATGNPPTQTKPYDGLVGPDGGSIRITYIVEGDPTYRDYGSFVTVAGQYQGSTAGIWRREYKENDPQTAPPGGTYKVWQGAILQEEGAYTR